MKYVTNCFNCKHEVEIKPGNVVWHRRRPFCWECRNKLIAKWAKENSIK